MKQSPLERENNNRLQPSKISSEGFLGTDTRSYQEIIEADETVLTKENVTKEQIASVLQDIYDKAKNNFGSEISIVSDFTTQFYESMGKIPSPFKGDGVFEKGEAVCRNISTDYVFSISALSIHLIKKYGFFQGTGSMYRLDPIQLCLLFKKVGLLPS